MTYYIIIKKFLKPITIHISSIIILFNVRYYAMNISTQFKRKADLTICNIWSLFS